MIGIVPNMYIVYFVAEYKLHYCLRQQATLPFTTTRNTTIHDNTKHYRLRRKDVLAFCTSVLVSADFE